MQLHEILKGIKIIEARGTLDKEVQDISFDSRKVHSGSVFVAVRGTQADGHQFIEKVSDTGVIAIVCERTEAKELPGTTVIIVENSAVALALMAANFYEHPSRKLQLIGITGTNGKTTTATLLYELMEGLGFKTGLISTVENKISKAVFPSTHTTPEPVQLNRLLDEMVKAGCEYVFMEISSHAVSQHRIEGLHFKGGVFTNITHDHLDYHGTFSAYMEAKKRFFDGLPAGAFALINADDKRSAIMVQNSRAKVYRYSLKKMTDFRAKIKENSLLGLHLEIDRQEVFARMIGEFNAYNLLSAYAVAVLLGMDPVRTLVVLSDLKGAEGRFEYLNHAEKGIIAIVDYAHTPDALEKVLLTIGHLRKGRGRIITVAGCGGDRDRAKRPLMAKVACDHSDQVILTSDNPRSEDPGAIISEMEAGIPANQRAKVISITDRLQAIRTACKLARNGDIILVAGKGHEKYQEIGGVKYPFDDKKVLKEALYEI